jgi:hypothetical protein
LIRGLVTHDLFLPGYWPEPYPGGRGADGRLPDDLALRIEQWAHTIHHRAAEAIMLHDDVFPPGSIGRTWAHRVIGICQSYPLRTELKLVRSHHA